MPKTSETILERMKSRGALPPPPHPKERRPSPGAQSTRELFLLGIIMLLYLFNCVVGFIFVEEDAFIDFRYAVNLVDGHGFVFNAGEEPVEGFSNFLWLIIITTFHGFGADPEVAARLAGILLGICAIFLSYQVVRLITGREGMLNLLPPAMIAFSPPLIYWYQGGLETSLFSVLILAVIYLHLIEDELIPRVPMSGVLCFLLSITRPEGVIFFVLFAVLKFPKAIREDARLGSYIAWFFACFIPILLFAMFRFANFQSLVPNTFYAKVNYDLPDAIKIGGLYTAGFFSDTRAWLWLAPFLAVLARARKERLWRNLLPLIVFAVYASFVFLVGGDFHLYYRFYAPLLPLLFITCTSGLWEIHDALHLNKPKLAQVMVFIFAIGILFISSAYYRSPAWRDINKIDILDRSTLSYRYEQLAKDPSGLEKRVNAWFEPSGDILEKTGKWLAENYPKETRLATEQAGKVPYFTKFHTFDLLGINDKAMARIIHNRLAFSEYLDAFNKADPDIVLLYFADEHFVDTQHIGKLVESPEFQGKYQLVKILDFNYIYHLDQDYSKHRQMLLFTRREKPLEGITPLKTKELINAFTTAGSEAGENVVPFVVEL